jgi:23S rRNA (cytosine1962-C5)-methyltransferase
VLRISLVRGEERRLRGGHPWVFSNEISAIAGERSRGATAEVYDAGGGYVGTGHYNPSSLIAVRLLSRTRQEIDNPEFFRQKIQVADSYRRSVYPGMDTYRVVYGESDGLSGLVVDRYGDCLSIQLLSAGMDARREMIVQALVEIFKPTGILARNDVSVRTLEGLDEKVEILFGTIPDAVWMEEHGLRFLVDLMAGQKTGHFLDQKENHLLLKGLSEGKEVLDCFCYSGSWGIHAAAFGAAAVTCIDISARAGSLAEENARVNGFLPRVSVETADVFERLRTLKHEGRDFDVVVLDPPAFVKSKKTIREAQKGYLTINRRAMELLRPGGYLVTCSCSYHMDREMFRDILRTSSQQAGREMRVTAACGQALDHPVLLGVPETEYLKCFLLQRI